MLMLGCSPPWGRPAQLGLFSNLCSYSPDIAPECCLQHDLSFGGGTPREFWIANHELALCLYSHDVDVPIVETYFQAVSSPLGWEAFHVTEAPQRKLPPGYPHTCERWRW